MTPLEELQAAHKRLRDLSDTHWLRWGWTTLRADESVIVSLGSAGGERAVCEAAGEQTADLIVTLHRTIDTQLAVLDAAIESESQGVLLFSATGPTALDLARAINGEAS